MEQPEATTSSEVGPAKPAAIPPKRFVRNQVPENIMNDPQLSAAISVLPSNYSFEVQKTVWRLRQAKVRSLALQFPEGLLLYATSLADIFQTFVDTIEDVVILGDVTYGACCIDDYTAASLRFPRALWALVSRSRWMSPACRASTSSWTSNSTSHTWSSA